MEPINCMVAKLFGGSLASMPNRAFDNEMTKRSIHELGPSESSDLSTADERDVKNKDRPAYATDVIAVFNWWVAVI